MTRYVLGFVFSEDLSKLLLIRKTHPKEQYGKLNGLGGVIKHAERTGQAMSREFREECGIHVPEKYWMVSSSHSQSIPSFYSITVYTARADILKAVSITNEIVVVMETEKVLNRISTGDSYLVKDCDLYIVEAYQNQLMLDHFNDKPLSRAMKEFSTHLRHSLMLLGYELQKPLSVLIRHLRQLKNAVSNLNWRVGK